MIPSETQFPEFVSGQVLSSDHLNQAFRYLDEQERATRANLVGIGIACGLVPRSSQDGLRLTISKGSGITSEGYLALLDDLEGAYTHYVDFDPARDLRYARFLPEQPGQRFPLWELKRSAAVPGATELSADFLDGEGVAAQRKVVMLFVELLREENKNCSPESCDDKGATIGVTVRPLLVRQGDILANHLGDGIGPILYNPGHAQPPELRMPRFDVAASALGSTGALLARYAQVLNKPFLDQVGERIEELFRPFSPLVSDDFGGVYPFQESLAESLTFIHAPDQELTAARLTSLQYCYDFVADLIAAYEELRRTALEVLATCCPDSSAFPRHLLLGVARTLPEEAPSFRHNFVPSPLFQRRDLLGRLRSLLRRLGMLWTGFEVPAPAATLARPDDQIRITPSTLGDAPLSHKAIPFYYKAAPSGWPLFESWNYERTQAKVADHNLSYRARDYAPPGSDSVVRPLAYDLEPFNFLRIEGHVGKPFGHVMAELKRQIREFRLPIDVIGLATGNDPSRAILIDGLTAIGIRSQLDQLKAELRCCFLQQLRYWGKLDVGHLKYGAIKIPDSALLQAKVVGKLEPVEDAPRAVTTRAAAPKAQAAGYAKGDSLQEALGDEAETAIAHAYLAGVKLGTKWKDQFVLPVPFGPDALLRYALTIIDEIEEIARLLATDELTDPVVDAIDAHRSTLASKLAELAALIENELASQRPYDKIRAYVGESEKAHVNALAAAMPEIGEDNADTAVLLLLNLGEQDKTQLMTQLVRFKGQPTTQTALLKTFFAKLELAELDVPDERNVKPTASPFLLELQNRIKGFNCLCAMDGLRALFECLKEVVERGRGANLLKTFVEHHPGIQHKAGAPIGGTFLIVFHRLESPRPAQPDRFEAASAKLGDGVVVADFFLPYIVASAEPPIVYQVIDREPPPESVDLTLEPSKDTGTLVYAAADEGPYDFTHPGGGQLIGGDPSNGVTTTAEGRHSFNPKAAAVQLGDDEKLELTFVYEKSEVRSDELEVTVFHSAEVALELEAEEILLEEIAVVTATVRFADAGLKWAVIDPSGARTQLAETGTSLQYTPTAAGKWVFRAEAAQAATKTSVTNETAVLVKARPEVGRLCGDLPKMIEAYIKLTATDPDFTGSVLVEFGIDEFYKRLAKVADGTDAEQRKFFDEVENGGRPLSDALLRWLQMLTQGAIQIGPKPQRQLMLEAYNQLARLALYVACLREADLDDAFTKLLSEAAAQLGRLVALDLTADERRPIGALAKTVVLELNRQGPEQKKPLYVAALLKLRSALSARR